MEGISPQSGGMGEGSVIEGLRLKSNDGFLSAQDWWETCGQNLGGDRSPSPSKVEGLRVKVREKMT